MNDYYHNGSVAVEANTTGMDNVAGFGARRFMQDMYQHPYHPQGDHQYHSNQPSDHHAYRQDHGADHHYYSDGQSASASTGYGHHQSLSKGLAALPSTSSSYDRRITNESSYPDYRQQEQRTHRHGQDQSHTRTRTAADSRTVWRSDTLESSATDSTAALAYARSGDSQYSRTEQLSSARRAPVPRITLADRATIYDDDYEEPADSSTLDAALRPPSPASATLGGVSSDASFTIVRATVLEPDLPKAKCADCGEKLDFEELANHSCQPSSASRPPLLTIQVPSLTSSSTLSSSATSPALTTPRSPFFDRYDTLIGDTGPLSPALLTTVTRVDKGRVDDDEDETPKAHAVRIVGTQAAIKVSHVKASSSTVAANNVEPHPGSSPPPQPVPMQRSASGTQADAAARRKMIEEQRAAKKKDMMASPMPRAATTTSLTKHSVSTDDLSRSVPARAATSNVAATTQRAQALAALESQHAKKGSSSSLSSTSTDASERMGSSSQHAAARGGLSSNITPSSSYERIEDGVDHPPAKVVSGSMSSTKQARDRGKVDLSSIEEMMKGLTASPEPMQRTLKAAPRKYGRDPEAAPVAPQRSKSAASATKTDRERALELELERLRDKERTRQLQAMRLREKKKRERAAKRCCICDCSLSSSRTPFVERDGKLLCARDWKELYLPKCRKCNLSVEKGAVKSSDGALRGVFHRSCFSCAACEAPFTDGSFYVFNNQPYCSRHYHRLNGSLCRECGGGIEGDCRQTDTGDRFHPHCFSCQYSSKSSGSVCGKVLADYYVVGGQRLCERHADKVGRRLAKAGQKQLDLRAQKRMTMLHSLR